MFYFLKRIGGNKTPQGNSDTSSLSGHKPSPETARKDSHPPSPTAKEAAAKSGGNHTPAPFAPLGTNAMTDNVATDRLYKAFRAGGGVDDGGGGSGKSDTSGSMDAVTQTDFEDVYFNMTTGERIHKPPRSSQYHTFPKPSAPATWSSSSNPHHGRRRESVDVASNTAPSPFLGMLNHGDQPSVLIDMSRPRLSRDEGVGGAIMKHQGKRRPSLRIELLAAPHSPTTELVAQDHGFALEGLEVPHFSGASRSLPSSGSDIFKPKDSRKSSHASIKPLSPSPAIMTRISVTQDTPPLRQHHHHQHHHHHRQRRPETLDVMFGSPPSSKGHSGKKHSSSTSASHHLRPSRAASLSPRHMSDGDKGASSLQVPETAPEPKSAPIPKHFYHQDEEGFFASSHSSNYATGRHFPHDGDASRRGILFFSRLAGAGRVSSNAAFDSSAGSGSSAMYGAGKSPAYKSGGFES